MVLIQLKSAYGRFSQLTSLYISDKIPKFVQTKTNVHVPREINVRSKEDIYQYLGRPMEAHNN